MSFLHNPTGHTADDEEAAPTIAAQAELTDVNRYLTGGDAGLDRRRRKGNGCKDGDIGRIVLATFLFFIST